MRTNFVEMCIQDPVITFEHAGQVQVVQGVQKVLNSQKLCEKQSSSTPTEGKLIGCSSNTRQPN